MGESRSKGGGKGDSQGVEGGQGWGNLGVKGLGSLREAAKERVGRGIAKV